jgi:ubiquinol-cytochrome c reductase cytochrome b subunit
VFGVTALMGALFTINPVWMYGSYDPSPVTAGSQPDWYMGWLDGAVRLTPGFFEVTLLGYTLSLNILIPALIIPGLITMPALLYPWIEQWVTGDRREHHLLDRPRNVPTRTGLGVMAITFYLLLLISGGNDIIASQLHLSINDITNVLRLIVFVLPPVAFVVTKRICLGLQRKDREKVLHGRETGTIYRTETGEFFEVHAPLDEHSQWVLVQHEPHRPVELPPAVDENGVRRPGSRFDGLRRRISRFFFEDRVEPVTPPELAAAHEEHHAIAAHAEEDEEQRQLPSVPVGD